MQLPRHSTPGQSFDDYPYAFPARSAVASQPHHLKQDQVVFDPAEARVGPSPYAEIFLHYNYTHLSSDGALGC